jgi:acyl carrier protein
MNSETFDKLAAIWSSILDVGRIAPGEDFFTLGGDSIKAASMIFKTERAFGVEIPLSMVAGSLTLEKMLALVETLSDAPEPAVEAGEI